MLKTTTQKTKIPKKISQTKTTSKRTLKTTPKPHTPSLTSPSSPQFNLPIKSVQNAFKSRRAMTTASIPSGNKQVNDVVPSEQTTTSVTGSKTSKKTLPADVTVTNESFNSPAIANHDIQTMSPGPIVVTEDKMVTMIQKHAKVKASKKFAASEYVRNHQPAVRAAILAIPAALTMWATHDLSLYLASLTDALGQDAELTSNVLMALGGFQAIVAAGLVSNANKILSLAGQPTEAVVQTIIRRALHSEKLTQTLGKNFKLGHFVSVGTKNGGPRWTNTKIRAYEEWLQHDAGKFTQPIPEIPFPKFTQKFLSAFPAFQTTAWNVAVAERVAADMKKNPEDYLDHDSESTSEEEVAENDHGVAAATATAAAATKPIEVTQHEPPTQLSDQMLRQRKAEVSSYHGWERYWKPRRLQFSAHLIGTQDEGLLLCEVEKFHFGVGFPQDGGKIQYKVFQFVSFKTGKVTPLDQFTERPSLLSHAHIEQLFDTIPTLDLAVDKASFDYILVEEKHQEEIKQILAENKKKIDVGIYH
jgi:hypothetical protein